MPAYPLTQGDMHQPATLLTLKQSLKTSTHTHTYIHILGRGAGVAWALESKGTQLPFNPAHPRVLTHAHHLINAHPCVLIYPHQRSTHISAFPCALPT
eukprot:1160308-Pelagomonas_calceolata.AAC.11